MMITYYARDGRLFPRKPVDKSAYRAWAQIQLEAEYPSATIVVDDSTESRSQVSVDVGVPSTELQVFVAKLFLNWYNSPDVVFL